MGSDLPQTNNTDKKTTKATAVVRCNADNGGILHRKIDSDRATTTTVVPSSMDVREETTRAAAVRHPNI